MNTIKKVNIYSIAQDLKLSTFLFSSSVGKKIKEIVLEETKPLESGNSLELNFEGIEVCDPAFANEMIIELQRYLIQKENIIFFLSNVSPSVLRNLEAALSFKNLKEKIKIRILQRISDNYSVIGLLEPCLKETFELLSSGKQISARDVANAFKIQINNASNRLKKLYGYNLLLRTEKIDSHGKQCIYYLPKLTR
jgi:hypothetical protein